MMEKYIISNSKNKLILLMWKLTLGYNIYIQRISIVAPFVLNEPMVIWFKMTQWKAKQYLVVRIMVLDSQNSRETSWERP
jgi:hypothetical protein